MAVEHNNVSFKCAIFMIAKETHQRKFENYKVRKQKVSGMKASKEKKFVKKGRKVLKKNVSKETRV